MPEHILNSEFMKFLTKIIVPALITTAVAIAIDVKDNVSKVSWLTIMMSVIIGTGGAYLCGDLIMERFKGGEITIAVSLVTTLTEKIFKYFLHKFKVDEFLTSVFNLFIGSKKQNPS